MGRLRRGRKGKIKETESQGPRGTPVPVWFSPHQMLPWLAGTTLEVAHTTVGALGGRKATRAVPYSSFPPSVYVKSLFSWLASMR